MKLVFIDNLFRNGGYEMTGTGFLVCFGIFILLVIIVAVVAVIAATTSAVSAFMQKNSDEEE